MAVRCLAWARDLTLQDELFGQDQWLQPRQQSLS